MNPSERSASKNAVKSIPLIGCNPTLILENSATDLIEILVKSIEEEHWYKNLDDESKFNARKIITSVVLHHKVCLEVMIKMVEVGLAFSADWMENDKTFKRLFVSVRLFFDLF